MDHSVICSVVKKHIDKLDKFDLILALNYDEYDSESEKISNELTTSSSIKDIAIIISKVFNSSFGENTPYTDYLKAADNIFNEISDK